MSELTTEEERAAWQNYTRRDDEAQRRIDKLIAHLEDAEKRASSLRLELGQMKVERDAHALYHKHFEAEAARLRSALEECRDSLLEIQNSLWHDRVKRGVSGRLLRAEAEIHRLIQNPWGDDDLYWEAVREVEKELGPSRTAAALEETP